MCEISYQQPPAPKWILNSPFPVRNDGSKQGVLQMLFDSPNGSWFFLPLYCINKWANPRSDSYNWPIKHRKVGILFHCSHDGAHEGGPLPSATCARVGQMPLHLLHGTKSSWLRLSVPLSPETGCSAVVEGPPPSTPAKVPASTYHSSAISSSAAERHQSPLLIRYTHGDDNMHWGTELQAMEINGLPIKTITHIRRVCFDWFSSSIQ